MEQNNACKNAFDVIQDEYDVSSRGDKFFLVHQETKNGVGRMRLFASAFLFWKRIFSHVLEESKA